MGKKVINKKLLKKTLRARGSDRQIPKTIEEMAELTQELCKHLIGNDANILEELADTKIMIEQMMLLFDSNGDVSDWIEVKQGRMREWLDRQR